MSDTHIESGRVTYSQELHDYAPDGDTHPQLTIETRDLGGGPYLVVNATEFAVDTPEELYELAKDAMRRLANERVSQ